MSLPQHVILAMGKAMSHKIIYQNTHDKWHCVPDEGGRYEGGLDESELDEGTYT